jgi:CheY-like chemotaxis protein
VFGIVRQSDGCVHVYSEPGLGTTFKIYFPAVTGPPSRPGDPVATLAVRGNETIMIVEDEDPVRRLAARSLRSHGYTVLTASDGRDAQTVLEAYSGSVDLLLTDVVMPHVSGPELAESLRLRFPHLRILFMSGYTGDAVVRHGLLEADVAFIQKPYTPMDLARKVRQVLDQ